MLLMLTVFKRVASVTLFKFFISDTVQNKSSETGRGLQLFKIKVFFFMSKNISNAEPPFTPYIATCTF